jgi:hypothetical protein
VLAADLLQSAINKAFREHALQAPISPDFGMDYPVIQYADDTLIILPACSQQLSIMKAILDKYAQSTRLYINYGKFLLVPINLQENSTGAFAQQLGCSIGKMPFTYLGLPLGTTKPTVMDLMPLVDMNERKMSASYMMMAYSGRVTVINSLLTSIAMFAMSSLHIPPKILEHIEKLRRHCLWKKKRKERNVHLLLLGTKYAYQNKEVELVF